MEMRSLQSAEAPVRFRYVSREYVLLQEQLHLLRNLLDWTEAARIAPNIVQVRPA